MSAEDGSDGTERAAGGPPLWRRQEPDSPCVQICVIHPGAKICIGCHRTGDEIAAWSRLSPEERSAVMQELPGRAPLLRAAGSRPSRRRRG
ncbi:MAG: DUF1289 domain-containing protein [Pseudomonadota bacterium]